MRLTCLVAFDGDAAFDAGLGCWPHAIPRPARTIVARINRLAETRFIVFSIRCLLGAKRPLVDICAIWSREGSGNHKNRFPPGLNRTRLAAIRPIRGTARPSPASSAA